MYAEYRRDLKHSYVLLESPEDTDMQTYPVRMLLSGEIPGLLNCTVQGVDGRSLFYYDITSRQSLTVLLEGRKVEMGLLETLLDGLFCALENMRSFLLPMDDLILEPEFIFLTPGAGKAVFCFLPGYGKQIGQSIRELTEYLLPQLDHSDQKAVAAGYGFYKKMMEEGRPLEELRECWEQDIRLRGGASYETAPQLKAGSTEYGSSMTEDGLPGEWEEKTENTGSLTDEERRKQILDSFFSEEDEENGGAGRYVAGGVGAGLLLSLVAARLLLSFVAFLWVCAAEAVVCGGALGIWILYRRRRAARTTEGNTAWESGNGGAHRTKETEGICEEGIYEEASGSRKGRLDREDEEQPGAQAHRREWTPRPRWSCQETESRPRKESESGGRERIAADRKRIGDKEGRGKEGRNNGGRDNGERDKGERDKGERDKGGRDGEERGKIEWDKEVRSREKRDWRGYGKQQLPPLYAETEFLDGEDPDIRPFGELIPIQPDTLPRISLTEDLILIGKLEGTADVLLEWPGISRIHAKIWREDGAYLLMDMNSRNGTAVNGKLLSGQEKAVLREGDELAFANLKYRFQMGAAGPQPGNR